MCIDPQVVGVDRKTGEVIRAGCRKCKRCIANNLTDKAGRCFAEALSSDTFVSMTLTYNRDAGDRSQMLLYRDVQLMLKRIRKDGFNVRYIVAGEYGSRRGRSHWHCVLYFRGKAPDMPPAEMQKQHWKYWCHEGRDAAPLGFVFVQKPNYSGMLYVVKYAFKDQRSDNAMKQSSMSKKPPLGHDFWPKLAKLRIDAGLPFSFEYTLPGARYKNGNAVRFWLSGVSAENAYAAHRAEWHARGNKSEPHVRSEDFDRVNRMIYGDANKLAKSRFYKKDGSSPFLEDRRVDKMVSYHQGFLVRLTDGHILFSGMHQGVHRTWPVRNLQDMIATARGRRVLSVPKLETTMAPF